MSSSFGQRIKISIFGQSHSEGIGVVIDGLPAGERIDMEQLLSFMARRAPGNGPLSTPRKEGDIPKILSGVVDSKTCGAPLCAVIENTNTRSKDYDGLLQVPRPGHSDFPAAIKHGFHNDIRGGGHFSARLMAPLCFAGGVAMQILERKGIHIGGHISQVAGIDDQKFDPVAITPEFMREISRKDFCVIDDKAGQAMREAILSAKDDCDSVGGVVECCVLGLPVGLGEPIFDGVENRLAAAIFAVPAVKGVEFGAGFDSAKLRGSENNDSYYMDGQDVRTRTNNHGGILGGLSSGMPVIVRAAFKPTSSIAKQQQSVDLISMKDAPLAVVGRHDPCVVTRAVPCVEAACAVTVLDMLY